MTASRPVFIAVDAMGGDYAPAEVLHGVELALASDSGINVLLVGGASVVEPLAEGHPGRVRAVATTEVIEMDEHPATAVRSKKDSSIVVATRLVRDGEAEAFFSAGSTGAAMAAATLVMGRIKGVHRPAIATVTAHGRPTGRPARRGCQRRLQAGAPRYSSPTWVPPTRRPCSEWSIPPLRCSTSVKSPAKGSQLRNRSPRLMAEQVPSFVGNIEGRALLDGKVDVVVTDGFTGNVALKLLEGTFARASRPGERRDDVGCVAHARCRRCSKPSLTRLKDRLDPDTYGGAPLLGVDGVCIIGHGSSNATAVENALKAAAQAARGNLTGQIRGGCCARARVVGDLPRSRWARSAGAPLRGRRSHVSRSAL